MDKGHGRVEVRTLEVTTWLAEYLGSDWPGCRPVFRLRRERRCGGKVEVEVVFGITSLTRERAGAAELLGLTRARTGGSRTVCISAATVPCARMPAGHDVGRVRR